jgi:hypothetical protein
MLFAGLLVEFVMATVVSNEDMAVEEVKPAGNTNNSRQQAHDCRSESRHLAQPFQCCIAAGTSQLTATSFPAVNAAVAL